MAYLRVKTFYQKRKDAQALIDFGFDGKVLSFDSKQQPKLIILKVIPCLFLTCSKKSKNYYHVFYYQGALLHYFNFYNKFF